jgi:CelD/BcsL family acetyltransferase involved in cellulose biosynthesis
MPEVQKKWRSEVIDTDDRFFNLQAEWQALQSLQSDPHSSPFLSWDWMYLWWIIYRQPHWRLAIGLIRCDEQLVAIFPFYIKKMGLRQLHFLGTGEAESEEVATEYLDCLISRDADVQAYAAQWLTTFLVDIDIIVFDRMLASATSMTLISWATQFPVVRQNESGRRYCLSIKDGSNFEKGFSSNLRRKYRKFQINRQSDEWQFERCETAQQLDAYFSELKRLHELRWKSKGKLGAFSSPRFQKFHRALAEKLLKEGRLYLALLSVRGENVACLYAMDAVKVRYFYQAGYAPVMQHMALGHLGHFLAIADAQQNGYDDYDFMGGKDGAYKSEYTLSGELIVSCVAAKNNWQMAAYLLGNKLSAWFA